MSTLALSFLLFLWLLLHSLHSLQVAGGLRHAPLAQDLRPVHADAKRSSILPLTVNCGLKLPFERMVSMYVHWSSGTITSAVAHTCPQLSHLRCLLIALSPEWRTCVTRPMPLVSWVLHSGHFIKSQAVGQRNGPKRLAMRPWLVQAPRNGPCICLGRR